MNRLANILAPVVLVAVLLAAWEIACNALQVPVYFLAPPSAIAASLAADAPALLKATGYTLAEALGALVIASLLAQALALTVALSPLLERAVKPLTVVLQVTPVIAIALLSAFVLFSERKAFAGLLKA